MFLRTRRTWANSCRLFPHWLPEWTFSFLLLLPLLNSAVSRCQLYWMRSHERGCSLHRVAFFSLFPNPVDPLLARKILPKPCHDHPQARITAVMLQYLNRGKKESLASFWNTLPRRAGLWNPPRVKKKGCWHRFRGLRKRYYFLSAMSVFRGRRNKNVVSLILIIHFRGLSKRERSLLIYARLFLSLSFKESIWVSWLNISQCWSLQNRRSMFLRFINLIDWRIFKLLNCR